MNYLYFFNKVLLILKPFKHLNHNYKELNMLDQIKSVGYYTGMGAAAGGVVGGVVGLANVPTICGVFAVQTFFLADFLNGKSNKNIDTGFQAFQGCQTTLPLAGAIAGALALGTIGLLYGVCKGCGVRVQSPITCRKVTVENTQE